MSFSKRDPYEYTDWPELNDLKRLSTALECCMGDTVRSLKALGQCSCNGSTLKLVFIALVRRAKEKDFCYPSWDYFADFCSMKRDAVNKALQAIEAAGFIVKEPYGRTCRYWLDWDVIQTLRCVKVVRQEKEEARKTGRQPVGKTDQSEKPTSQSGTTSRKNRLALVGKTDSTSRENRLHQSENPTLVISQETQREIQEECLSAEKNSQPPDLSALSPSGKRKFQVLTGGGVDEQDAIDLVAVLESGERSMRPYALMRALKIRNAEARTLVACFSESRIWDVVEYAAKQPDVGNFAGLVITLLDKSEPKDRTNSDQLRQEFNRVVKRHKANQAAVSA